MSIKKFASVCNVNTKVNNCDISKNKKDINLTCVEMRSDYLTLNLTTNKKYWPNFTFFFFCIFKDVGNIYFLFANKIIHFVLAFSN